MQISIFDLINPHFKISVDLSEDLKDRIKSKIKDGLRYFSEKLNIKVARLYEYFIWQNSAIPLEVLLELSNLIKIQKEDIEKNIIMYKQLHVPNKNSIKKPNLPIKITPYFTSLVANLFFDGSVPDDGKGTYYNQKNKEIMDDFINKIKEIFGDVSYSISIDSKSVLKCRLPRLIGEICRHVYNVNSFGTFDARIPKIIFDLDKEHKSSFILTGIIDEGSIAYDGSIIFGVSNKEMIEKFNCLCKDVGIVTKEPKQKRNSNHYYTYVTSIREFFKLYKHINKKYSFISLRHKEERLEKCLKIKNKRYYPTKQFASKRKALILKELKNKDCSINYLSSHYLFPPRTIRRYMYSLMKECKVTRKKISSEYIYSSK